jgi:hypothetical protein
VYNKRFNINTLDNLDHTAKELRDRLLPKQHRSRATLDHTGRP